MSAILYISPNLAVRRAVQRHLTRYGYLVVPAATASEGLRAAMTLSISAVVFDTASPGETVETFLPLFRSSPERRQVPFVIVAGPAAQRRLEASPCLAAWDVVVQRPFTPTALLRDVERALAAAGGSGPPRTWPLTLDRRRQTAHAGDRSQRLTPTEFRLLAFLLDHCGEVVTHDRLLEGVWGYTKDTGSPELVRTHVMNLRRKLACLPGADRVIETIPSIGYQLRLDLRDEP